MAASSGLAPPGSSTYNSNTMTVGDGTWDAERNTFLLPNLMGLDFDTMRYNGMGNRFKEVPQYFSLVQAHGILAVLVFLLLVPIAIMTVRFHSRNPPWALRIHIWCQILTVLLTTVLFALGCFAVGPQRSLTNPHHGIGVAIYVLVLVQFLGGWWVHVRERKSRPLVIPVKVVLHKWFGRTIGLLGLLQIPLGLTLYGAPLYLFVLYTLTTFALLVIYFILSYRREARRGRDHYDEYSYASGSGSIDRREPSRFGTMAKAAAAGLGVAALASRFGRGRRDRDDGDGGGSRRHSGSYLEEEKHVQYGRDPGREGGWGRKILGLGALAGVGYWAGKMLGRRRQEDEMTETATHSSEESSLGRIERVEEGRPTPGRQPLDAPPHPPLGQPPSQRRSRSSLSFSESYVSREGGRKGHGFRDAVVGLGAFGLARNILAKRKERKEQRRIDELREREMEDERINRQHSKRQKFTGDGIPRRGGRRGSLGGTGTDYSDSRPYLESGAPPVPGAPPMPAGAVGAAGPSRPVASGALPMPPTIHEQGRVHGSSGSDILSADGRRRPRSRSGRDALVAGLAGGAAGLMAGEAMASRRSRERSRRRRSTSAGEGSAVASPPVSVKVKMHSDGRHVTLRRLPEEEAAAERAARRQNGRRRRAGGGSELSDTDPGIGGDRWRRAEDGERQEAEEMERAAERQRLQASQARLNASQLAMPLPPPPPIPTGDMPRPGGAGSVGAASIGSPGTYDGTGTEASGDYAGNRKRRRAERAQARLMREGRVAAGPSGDFT